MVKRKSLIAGAAAVILLGPGTVQAGFGDAVVGGVVGGVVGSVITNEIYRSGHRSHRRTSHRRRHRAPQAAIETDEMKIQRALQSLGYYRGPIDGQINSFTTRTAIKEFNRAYEISDTAYMSPQERDALTYLGTLLELDKSLNSQGSDRRSRTRRVQAALKVLGFYTGKIDGSSGPMTRRAIASYRQAYGLGPGTRLGYEDEYRLITTAKQSNDRNIQETIDSLKRLGSTGRQQTMGRQPAVPAAPQQPVILQATPAAVPVQPTITQQAPAPRSPSVPAVAPGAPATANSAAVQQPPVPNTMQNTVPVAPMATSPQPTMDQKQEEAIPQAQ